MASIGIGILSFAHAHVSTYAREMSRWDDVRLLRAWDDDAERGESRSAEFGCRFSPHLEEVLDDPSIDAVIVASETSKHVDLVIPALEAGKAVLLQKPMAISVEDCDRICSAARRTGGRLDMAWQMRCDPVNRFMKRITEEGECGRIGTIRRRHCLNLLFNPAFATGPSRWHIDPELNLGMWMDDACHAADFLFWFLGKPVSVTAEIDNVLTDVAPDDTGMAIFRFGGGEFGLLYNASVTLAAEITTEIYGDRGALHHYYGDGVSTPHAPPDAAAVRQFVRDASPAWRDHRLPIPATHGERIAAVPRPWIDRLLSDAPPECDAEGGRVSTLMCLAAYESSRQGRRIVFGQDYPAL